ncbi:hypothetical protein [Pseudoalteromonas luteoviolacea]|uniref:Uncharacterized protein n=1 Tax=Pseudoalteromonas luteoviolacea S4060-1 TaxID=1365257 RepID=A0A161YJS3_9GAMM|nr:hypothetical protein [Pseudoalteromonas luteoviolacea]KZN61540.1 hypothetical protein N478_05555 [Pseudoalteromonas luteoviolacea S4060-1]
MITEQSIKSLGLSPEAESIFMTMHQEIEALNEKLDEGDERLVSTAEAMSYLRIARNKFCDLSKEHDDFPKAVTYGYTHYYRFGDVKAFRKKLVDEARAGGNS